MAAEFLAEPGPPIPDRVPDDLNRRYGASARRTVRGRPHRKRLAPRLSPAPRLRAMTAGLPNGEVWTVALIVFGGSIIGLGMAAAVIYAVTLFPLVGTIVLITVLALMTVSYYAAVKFVRREQSQAGAEPYA